MNKLWILLLGLLVASPISADWWQGLKAYESQDYALAKTQFSQLLTLGNEDAAFNLGVMYVNGQGVEADKIMALAYFTLAEELGRKNAATVTEQLRQQIDARQLAKAGQQLTLLRQIVRVWPSPAQEPGTIENLPKPVKRVEPKYPLEAARAGLFGYVAMRYLVDEQGKVQAIDVVDAYPEKIFNREAIQALKRWRYEATDKKHLLDVRLDFSLGGLEIVDKVDTFIEQNQLWQGSLLGSSQHQLLLGSVLQLAHIQSGSHLEADRDIPVSDQLDLSVFRQRNRVTTDLDGFFGEAIVRVSVDGAIIEQLKADFAPESKLDVLVGLKLKGTLDTDVYRILRNTDQPSRAAGVAPFFKVPANLFAHFWWDKAAKNGNTAAQRIMAAYDKRWEQFLLEEQDPEAMAWVGSRMLLEGEREAGLALLDAAIAKHYAHAAELKKQLI